MRKNMQLIVFIAMATLLSPSLLAKGKDHRNSPPDSRFENSNRQSWESSVRGQERSEQRHDQHPRQNYGHPDYNHQNPADAFMERGNEQLRYGVQELNRRAADGFNQEIRQLAPPPHHR